MKKLSIILIAAAIVGAAVIINKADALTGSSGECGEKTSASRKLGDKHSYDHLLEVAIPAKLPSQMKQYAGFTLSFNADNHTPNYSAWKLTRDNLNNNTVSRSNNFWQDPQIKGCPEYSDYSKSGYDRGHLCPAGDNKWSVEAMEECFVMANMCPQDGGLNSGAWNTLEQHTRDWARRDGTLIVVAGPIYEASDTKRIGKNNVRVPSAFFKVILAPDVPNPRAIGFIYPNMRSPGNMSLYSMSVDEVEKITGFDFFAALPDDVENFVEASATFSDWTSRRQDKKHQKQ